MRFYSSWKTTRDRFVTNRQHKICNIKLNHVIERSFSKRLINHHFIISSHLHLTFDRFVWFIIWIFIFFKHEVMFLIQLWLDHWLQDLINIYTLTHLFVDIVRNVVKINVWLEIMTHNCLAMMTFDIFSIWFFCMLNKILTISLIKSSNDEKFALWSSFKIIVRDINLTFQNIYPSWK
jgi:hypothetical protein